MLTQHLSKYKTMDEVLLRALNAGIAGPASDWLWVLITTPETWWGPVAALAGGLTYFDRVRGATIVVLAVLVVLVADAATFYLIKPYFARPRPCNALEGIRVVIGCTNSFSFPSNHSVNSMAMAGFLGWLYRPLFLMLLTIGILVSISRVAVGVHYPSDVIAGGVLGFSFGWIMAMACKTYMLNKSKTNLGR